ncbi:ABC-F family ATP-binding cassette domain-containing protein [Desulforhopalus sp. IMCC35007]|uniref:ABC-F family ATP-binding cassette domain-containing protein n=1 Tax=Desulforhopalus sp. IMCC35007 TaxID=2569543 RepID=UPI0010AEC4F8|nr:ABC-F family ATP-binding cassette domain-containing protein [Desulforhopalus sp. IMCC35007]TKB08578.1 ABC-F family ATP-binding cassette domain-containing protein [Desulforhopalus sp. IMCC35007]
MSNIIVCKGVSKAYGAQELFQNIDLVVHSGDRIGVIGPNGSGKSTLLKIICRLEEADSGQIVRQKFIRLSYLAQEDLFDDDRSVFDNLLVSLEDEDLEETEKYTLVHTLLSRAEFPDNDDKVVNLSGGWRKRLSICRALLAKPDVLVMDEPTNHLDIEGILWLEKILTGPNSPQAYLLVSHDRRFLENCTNRIVELSAVYPEGTLQVQGPYSKFLEVRDEFLAGQEEEELRLANKARREIEWLRRGPKARATKAKYRIDEAYKLTDDLADVKARNRSISSVQIGFEATGRKTKKLLEMIGVSKAYDDKVLFENIDITLAPKSRLGLLGRNGCGKSTLMKIMAAAADEENGADSGTIKVAENVKIVTFDQNRKGIDPTLTLKRALAPDGDSVVYGDRSLHVVSWAKKFLFRPDQLETQVGQLSGGEQARILIASLMRSPADILLLDEPTNDLDIASLDVLESSLLEFPGALVLVTHDRFLLDRICDRLLGFGGRSGVTYYADYEQWLDDLPEEVQEKKAMKKTVPAQAQKKSGRLSYIDQREYDQIEENIAVGEQRVGELQAKMESPEVVSDSEKLSACWAELETAQEEVEKLYERWDELEAKIEG